MAHAHPGNLMASAGEELIEAVFELHGNVFHAFAQEPDYPRTPFNERERYSAALVAAAQFFIRLGEGQIGERFFELASAIADLNSGTQHPILVPVRTDNRRPDTSQMWRARASVALALEAAIRSGLSQGAAAARIARKFPSLTKLAGSRAKNSPLETIVLGWRKELKAARIKNFQAGELFSEGMKKIDSLSSSPSPDLSEFAAGHLTAAAGFCGVLSPSS
jgi:hypothetical protein